MSEQQFVRAIDRIDAANRADPRLVRDGDRQSPHELLYSMRMTACLARIRSGASDVRAQHLCRWLIVSDGSCRLSPLASELTWRADLANFHAEKARQILRGVGYDDATIARVQSLARKANLKADEEAQCLEDVAALVFLEFELPDFARKHAAEQERLVRILQRTWKKMSPRGQAAASQLQLAENERRLLQSALNPMRAAPRPGEPEAS